MMSCEATLTRKQVTKTKRSKRQTSSKKIYLRTKHGARIMSKRCRPQLMNFPCFKATEVKSDKFTPAKDHSFDTDSFLIGINSHASYSLTNNKEDFIDTPRQVRVGVKGIAGRLTSGSVGTV